ncbi:MAG: hypothetical protein A2Y10_07915 [Planctomycetes bacterium GWF2_41_51]|nr:MAG: hypothetical protein A2Y10_07915 [Planctomycetes bacterium GWF2_41_51]
MEKISIEVGFITIIGIEDILLRVMTIVSEKVVLFTGSVTIDLTSMVAILTSTTVISRIGCQAGHIFTIRIYPVMATAITVQAITVRVIMVLVITTADTIDTILQ